MNKPKLVAPRYETPSIHSIKASAVLAAMGPAYAIYGDPGGGGGGSGGGTIGN